MKKIFILAALAISAAANSQIERKILDYSINGHEVVRRFGPKAEFDIASGGSVSMTLYSDSVCGYRQTLCILACFSIEVNSTEAAMIARYEDGMMEEVPKFRDSERCTVYYFVDRLKHATHKRLDSITLVGIGDFEMDPEFLIGFAREIGIR